VRCGACNHVFQAERHLVSAEPAVSGPAAEESRTVDACDIEQSYIEEMLLGFPAADAALSAATAGDAEAAPAPQDEPDAAVAPVGETPAPPAQAQDQPDEPPPRTIDATTRAFEPPPVEIEAPTAPRRRSVGWTISSAALVLLLLAQYGWHERDRLLRDDRTRPRLDAVCAALGCVLPRPAAPALVRSDGLVVRPAPGRAGVLLVDALLTNRAAYPQPWPALEIVFQDIEGRPLAGRVFAPQEYLPAPPAADMPVAQAVAVHLEIRDPGDEATNYHLRLRQNPAGR
jgi:hypothetical protein